MDHHLDIGRVGAGQIVRRWIAIEERWGNHVDPNVGALRRHDCGHQQLKRIAVIKLTNSFGVFDGEATRHFFGTAFGGTG